MARFTTEVPAGAQAALEVEAAFQRIIDESETSFRAASEPASAKALLAAVFSAIDEASKLRIGLSASRFVDGDSVSWNVFLGVDTQMTVICSEIDYTEAAPEKIAAVILQCWDVEWDG